MLLCPEPQGMACPGCPCPHAVTCSSEDRPGDRLDAHHHHQPGGQSPGCCSHLQGHTGAGQGPQSPRGGVTPQCSPRHHRSLTTEVLSPLAQLGLSGGTGSTRKVLQGQNQSRSHPTLGHTFPSCLDRHNLCTLCKPRSVSQESLW